jgi:hypothetical protein
LEGLLERNAVLQSPSRIEELVKIFIHATKVRLTLIQREVIADFLDRWRLDSGIWALEMHKIIMAG